MQLLWALHWFYLGWIVDVALYTEIPDSHPVVTGWSVIMVCFVCVYVCVLCSAHAVSLRQGMYAFGLEGVLIGPILVIITALLYRVLHTTFHHDAEDFD